MEILAIDKWMIYFQGRRLIMPWQAVTEDIQGLLAKEIQIFICYTYKGPVEARNPWQPLCQSLI